MKKIVSNYLSTGTGPPSVDIYCFSDYFANCINIRKYFIHVSFKYESRKESEYVYLTRQILIILSMVNYADSRYTHKY